MGSTSRLANNPANTHDLDADLGFPDIDRGAESDSYPEPYEFRKRELVAACRQAMKMSGMGGKYPRPWTINDEPTDYMAFPILPGQRLWAGGEPGRFRIVYHKSDGAFYRVVMHRYKTPLAEKETAGLGFCWVGEKCGQEDIQSPTEQSTKLVKSPPGVSYPSNDKQSHPLRQNPPSVKSPPVATTRFSDFRSLPFADDHLPGHSPRAATLPTSANRKPSYNQGHPLVKVKSAPGTLRRSGHSQPLPVEQKTFLVKSPPSATPESRSTDFQALPPPSGDTRRVKSSPAAQHRSSIVASPDFDENGHFVTSRAALPRILRIIPPPSLVHQNGLGIKSLPTATRRSSNTPPSSANQNHAGVLSPAMNARPFGYAPSPVVDQNVHFIKSLPATTQQSRNTLSPLVDQNAVFVQSPSMDPRPFSQLSMIPPPLAPKNSRSVKSPPATPHITSNTQSPIVGYNPRLPISPRAASYSFSSIQPPVITQESPTVKSPTLSPMTKSPTLSPKIKSPIMSPQAFSNFRSPSVGYDPRLPVRSPRVSAHPFNNSQSHILGQETPQVRSPAIVIHPSRYSQSPVVGHDPRLFMSPPVTQI